jgi:hypothetical protein
MLLRELWTRVVRSAPTRHSGRVLMEYGVILLAIIVAIILALLALRPRIP